VLRPFSIDVIDVEVPGRAAVVSYSSGRGFPALPTHAGIKLNRSSSSIASNCQRGELSISIYAYQKEYKNDADEGIRDKTKAVHPTR
jgi:hypothetical protein